MLVARVMASKEYSDNVVNNGENNQSEHEKCISEFLDDTETRELIIQMLRPRGEGSAG